MRYDSNGKIIYGEGDWVTCIRIEGVRRGSGWKDGLTFQVKSIIPDVSDILFGGLNNNGVYSISVRPATREEINKVLKGDKIFIDELEVKFDFEPKEWIRVGCKIISKELFLKIGKKAGWL